MLDCVRSDTLVCFALNTLNSARGDVSGLPDLYIRPLNTFLFWLVSVFTLQNKFAPTTNRRKKKVVFCITNFYFWLDFSLIL